MLALVGAVKPNRPLSPLGPLGLLGTICWKVGWTSLIKSNSKSNGNSNRSSKSNSYGTIRSFSDYLTRFAWLLLACVSNAVMSNSVQHTGGGVGGGGGAEPGGKRPTSEVKSGEAGRRGVENGRQRRMGGSGEGTPPRRLGRRPRRIFYHMV